MGNSTSITNDVTFMGQYINDYWTQRPLQPYPYKSREQHIKYRRKTIRLKHQS